MELTRRQFVKGLTATASLAVFANPFDAWANAVPTSNGRFLMGAENEMVCYHLADDTVQRIPLGFNPHSIFPHPTDPNKVWAVEKIGTHAATVDLAKGKVTHSFQSPQNAFFYGHAAFQPSTDTLFVACMRYADRTGHLVGYDANDYTVRSDDFICTGPVHDVQFMPDGNILAATTEVSFSGGVPKPIMPGVIMDDWQLVSSALLVLDPATRQRLKTLPIADGDTQGLTHMHQLKSGGFIAISAPWPRDGSGAVYFAPHDTAPLTRVACGAEMEKKFKYEFLSVAVDEENHMAAVTNPTGHYVVFIDTHTGAFLGGINEKFTNVAFDSATGQFMAAALGRIVAISPAGIGKVMVDGLENALHKPLQFSSAHSVVI